MSLEWSDLGSESRAAVQNRGDFRNEDPATLVEKLQQLTLDKPFPGIHSVLARNDSHPSARKKGSRGKGKGKTRSATGMNPNATDLNPLDPRGAGNEGMPRMMSDSAALFRALERNASGAGGRSNIIISRVDEDTVFQLPPVPILSSHLSPPQPQILQAIADAQNAANSRAQAQAQAQSPAEAASPRAHTQPNPHVSFHGQHTQQPPPQQQQQRPYKPSQGRQGQAAHPQQARAASPQPSYPPHPHASRSHPYPQDGPHQYYAPAPLPSFHPGTPLAAVSPAMGPPPAHSVGPLDPVLLPTPQGHMLLYAPRTPIFYSPAVTAPTIVGSHMAPPGHASDPVAASHSRAQAPYAPAHHGYGPAMQQQPPQLAMVGYSHGQSAQGAYQGRRQAASGWESQGPQGQGQGR